jgi:hypothetical protein
MTCPLQLLLMLVPVLAALQHTLRDCCAANWPLLLQCTARLCLWQVVFWLCRANCTCQRTGYDLCAACVQPHAARCLDAS